MSLSTLGERCARALLAVCAWALTAPTTALAQTTIATPPACARPVHSTGTGAYVACSRINGPDGTEFKLRGIARAHFEVPAAPYIAATKATAVRTEYSYRLGTVVQFHADVQGLLAHHLLPVAAIDAEPSPSAAINAAAVWAAQVDHWVSDAGTWTLLNTLGMVDLSTVGSVGSVAARAQASAAVATLRRAGYTLPIMLGADACEEPSALGANAARVTAADPQQNLVFLVRCQPASQAALHALAAALAAAARNDPRLAFVWAVSQQSSAARTAPLAPADLIQTAEANHLGWLAWRWDGPAAAACSADAESLLAHPCAGYMGEPSQLTPYGRTVVAQLAAESAAFTASDAGGSTLTDQSTAVPPEAALAGYIVNTFSVANFTSGTVDTTNSQLAGFKFYPYTLFNTPATLTDLQLNADGSITLLGSNTGPNGEIITATPLNGNKAYHGTAFGGGALFEATLEFSAGNYSLGASGGWPAWWAQPLETGVIYASGSDQWPGQVAGYHHGVENDFMEYLNGIMGAAVHESWGVYEVTCPPNYCQYSSSLPRRVLPDLTQLHRYGCLWIPATATSAGQVQYFLDGALQASQSWQQFTSQPPPPTGQPWAFGAMDEAHYVLILGTGPGAPLRVTAVNVWQKNASQNLSN